MAQSREKGREEEVRSAPEIEGSEIGSSSVSSVSSSRLQPRRGLRSRTILLRYPPDMGEDHASDDSWCDDGLSSEVSDSELNREQKRRHDHFYTVSLLRFKAFKFQNQSASLTQVYMGYRDGISAGKESSAQEGFNIGFKQSVQDGYKWGIVRGITSAFASLADHSKEKLVKKIEDRDKFHSLYESSQEISADDALKMYHNQLLQKSQPDKKSEGNVESTRLAEEDLECNKLGSLYIDLTSFVSDSSEMKLNFELANDETKIIEKGWKSEKC
ncbi:protein yae1 isoform X3 [Canna indica]|uniref:Protein yae1 isoform X3 n=1 Tax=Canna indica TaxID=4628 RepID=A0AAQ3Q4S3_9LILI|nr:protein yae1 isoform X3 [Canna indica]